MSFTATWTATTGFDTSGYTVTFGKQLNQCTIEELTAHPMCGSVNPIANCAYVGKESELGASSVYMNLANAQFKMPIPNSQSNTWVCDPAPSGDDALIYRRSVFVGMPSNVSSPQYCLTDECDNRILIIEDIKAPNKLVFNYGSISFNVGAVPEYKTMANQLRHTCNKGQSAYASAPSTITYVDNTDPNNPSTTTYKVCLYHVYTVGNDCFMVGYDYIGQFGGRYKDANTQYNYISGGLNYKSFKHANGNCLFLGLNTNSTGGETNLQGIFGSDIYADPVPTPAVFKDTYITYAPQNIILPNARLRFWMSNSTLSGSLFSGSLSVALVDTEEIRKQQFARAGVYFVVNGELFKPIISGGIVTGYGTPEKQSEIDTYTDLNHPVPTGGGGGGGGGGGDNEIDIPARDHASINGFVKYYLIDRTTADRLSDALSRVDWTTIGRDLMACLISYKLFAVSGFSQGAARTITIGGVEMTDAGGDGIQGIPVTGVSSIHIGSISIPHTFNDFRDYAPYTKIEIFVPFCGWAQLPSWSMGKTISGDIYIDLANGTVKALIYASRTVVAELGGNCATDIPFSATANGVKAANVISNLASGMTAAFNPTPQGIISGGVGILTAFNANYTNVKGVMGDGSNIDGITGVLIKVTRPASIDDSMNDLRTIPSQYKHDRGIPCGKQLTLAAGDGYTQVIDANISGNMTAAEKQMIIDGFRHGLIISANPT